METEYYITEWAGLDDIICRIKDANVGTFLLQVNEGTTGLVEGCVSGTRSELSAALLEVMQCYMGQAELLCEIQALRSRWTPEAAVRWPASRHMTFDWGGLLWTNGPGPKWLKIMWPQGHVKLKFVLEVVSQDLLCSQLRHRLASRSAAAHLPEVCVSSLSPGGGGGIPEQRAGPAAVGTERRTTCGHIWTEGTTTSLWEQEWL